jgi:hypothetical protein
VRSLSAASHGLGTISFTSVPLPKVLSFARAKKLDRYCRVIVSGIFVIASIAIFAHPRG